MSIFTIISKVLGVILLLAWLIYIPIGRYWFRRRGGLMYATLFQWHILPFIIGVGLIASGNLLVILVFPFAWILSIFFPNFFMLVFPLVSGWINGGLVYSCFYPDSNLWYYVSCAVGTLTTFLVCTIVTAIVAGPYDWPWER
jgi:hypothetical protein